MQLYGIKNENDVLIIMCQIAQPVVPKLKPLDRRGTLQAYLWMCSDLKFQAWPWAHGGFLEGGSFSSAWQ